MRVLSILPFPVLPLTHGGRVRAYRLAVGLARAGATVELTCPWQPGLPFHQFERDGITIRPFVFAANVLPAVLGDRFMPPLLQLSGQPFTLGPRRLLRQTQDYDVVEFHFCAYASWMSRVAATAVVVYSAHNVELDYALAEPGSKLRRMFARQVGKLERHAVSVSDFVVTCTNFDGKRLAQLYGGRSNYAVVSNGFDDQEIAAVPEVNREEARRRLGLAPDELAILFVGGRAAHNRRAVRFLEDELLPALKLPARLLIAGECARPHRSDRVLSLGRVETLSPLFTAADVAVNPIDSGSGSNVKIAEYLGSGLPVVTTTIGLRGYEAFAHLMTVAELDKFAGAVQAKHQRSAPSPEVAQLNWTALGRRLYEIYAHLLTQRLPSSSSPGVSPA